MVVKVPDDGEYGACHFGSALATDRTACLVVCRQLVLAMGGRIWATRATGPATGAEFGFWLPGGLEEDDPAEG